MILVIGIILLIIAFEILLLRIDKRIDLIMKDLGVEESTHKEKKHKIFKNRIK